jgi:hypothetical protein
MKKIIVALIAISMMLVTTTAVLAAKPTTDFWDIKSGEITYTDGTTPIEIGYDQWGYNYQAHLFNGYYGNAGRPTTPVTSGTWLQMKWNDAWLSNKDYKHDEDTLLDRHYGHSSYIGSGAWLTNHQWGDYPGDVGGKYDIGGSLYLGEVAGIAGWSDTWTWGGGYGGGDDGTLRLLMGPGDGCGDGYRDAYFEIDTNGVYMNSITLNHLDGSQSDNFILSMLTGYESDLVTPIWTQISDEYLSAGGGESWVESQYTFSPVSGVVQFQLFATGTVTGWCNTWGQVAFSWVEWSEAAFWNYFVKIVAAPIDAYKADDIWYTSDGIEIGPVIWGSFAIVQQVENDPYADIHGLQSKGLAPTGFGYY